MLKWHGSPGVSSRVSLRCASRECNVLQSKVKCREQRLATVDIEARSTVYPQDASPATPPVGPAVDRRLRTGSAVPVKYRQLSEMRLKFSS
jgi:hypothetical protein